MALKWRPQVFADMVGQEQVTRTLQNAIKADRIAHAYIFAGPRGVGKTTTARIFAKALNCRNPKDAEPCNACDICDEVNQGSAMDVIEIDAASFNKIDNIRELQEQVGTYPAKGKYKVYIFDEAHRITPQAFDAFLKTLEEPPPHVIFILASTEIHQFPATVQSRCQRFEFRSMGMDTLVRQLKHISKAEGIEIDDPTLHQVARAANGSMRDGQRTLDQIIAFSGKKVTLEDIRMALGTIEAEIFIKLAEAALVQDAPAGLTLVRSVLDSGRDLEFFYSGLMETFRHLAVAKAFPSSAGQLIPLSAEEVKRLSELAQRMEEAQILSSLRLLIEQEWAVRHSGNPTVVIETVVLELCRLGSLLSVGDLLKQAEKGVLPTVSLPSRPAPIVPAVTTVREKSAPYEPEPSNPPAPSEGEPALAVSEIEDAAEPGSSPEFAKIKGRWREILEKVAAQKKALEAILRDTHPKKLDENTLVLSCLGPFHQEQMSKAENKIIVEKILEEEIGRPVHLVPVLSAPVSSNPAKTSGPRAPKPLSVPNIDTKELEKEEPIVAAAMKMFGGKIVEVKRTPPAK
jgi:DNA polymerase-3 subunit gamma/tau